MSDHASNSTISTDRFPMETHDIREGCHAESWAGTNGCGALVIHGFTGSPFSVRPVAVALAQAGFAVEMPRLPGHGTNVEDMKKTTWLDWSQHVDTVFKDLAARSVRTVVVGLSLGGTLSTWLGIQHPDIAGLVLVNPAVEPAAADFVELIRAAVASGTDVFPGIGADIAKPDTAELAYPETPLVPLLTMMEHGPVLDAALPTITMPTLYYVSTQDHVVPPSAADHYASNVSGPVERVVLERSFHVATLDFDAQIIQDGAVEFAQKVCNL